MIKINSPLRTILSKNSKGLVTPLVFYIVVFVLIGGAIMLSDSNNILKLASRHKEFKTASGLANNAVTEIMAQFSKFDREDHMDSGNLNRVATSFSNGISTISFTTIPTERAVYFKTTGSVNNQGLGLYGKKSIEGVVKFESNFLRFGTLLNGDHTVFMDCYPCGPTQGIWNTGMDFDGPLWVTGNLTVGNSQKIMHVHFATGTLAGGAPAFGPVIIGNNFNLVKDSVTINSDLFVGGTINCGVAAAKLGLNGNLYYNKATPACVNINPDYAKKPYIFISSHIAMPPPMDLNYLKTQSNLSLTTDSPYNVVRISFTAWSASSTVSYTPGTWDGTNFTGKPATIPQVLTINPSRGMIIYGENIDFLLYGTLRARLTIAAARTAATGGKITVVDPGIFYSDPTNPTLNNGSLTNHISSSASPTVSFAAIAQKNITFKDRRTVNALPGSGPIFSVRGLFYVLDPNNDGGDTATATNTALHPGNGEGCYLSIYGTINKLYGGGFNKHEFHYDPNLGLYPPPGIPEKARLVSYRVK